VTWWDFSGREAAAELPARAGEPIPDKPHDMRALMWQQFVQCREMKENLMNINE
jgi:hypothetical protein